jgi:hypothetical protein
MLSRALKLSCGWVAAGGCVACGWAATLVPIADGAQLPHSASGHKVTLVASGLQTPTAFAFGAGNVFVSDFGSQNGTGPGGVYVLKRGSGRRLVGWNGSRFTRTRTIYTASNAFTGFNGLGFGADGRLYAGVALSEVNDHSPTSAPYAFDVLSFNSAGEDLKVVARGLRQPFQLAFPAGSSSPFVSDLGQDLPPGIAAPDYVVRLHEGDNYGFPKCNWLVKLACRGFTKPLEFLHPHASPMGLGIIGNRLYMALFGAGPNSFAEVVSMPLGGGALRTVVSGFAAPIVALNADAGSVYVGETNGLVFRFKP